MSDSLGDDNVTWLRNGPIGPVPDPEPEDETQLLQPFFVLAIVGAAMLFGFAIGRASENDPVTVVLVLLGYSAGWMSAAALSLWFRKKFRRWLRGR